MKKVTLKSTLISFSKEWILPTIGKAVIAVPLTILLINQLENSTSSIELQNAMMELVAKPSSIFISVCFAVLALLLIAAMGIKAKAAWSAPSPNLHRFSRYASIFGVCVSFLMGTLILPMVLWATMAVKLSKGSVWSDPNIQMFSLTFLVFFIVSLTLHWLTLDNKNDAKSAIVWTLMGPPDADAEGASTALQKHFSPIPWFESAEVTGTAEDGHAIVELPLVYAIKKWSEKDCTAFMDLYEKRANALKGSPFKVASVALSPELKEFIEKHRARKSSRPARTNNTR